ncbi:MAG: HNH endonuclease [Acidobacteria bacterium]|nr:HNH endonuclease [Acidobacteriota bacterium]
MIHLTPPSLENEEWKPWPRKPSLLVSSLGRVWSTKRGKFRAINIGTDGYPYVSIWMGPKLTSFRLHVMVLSTFRPKEDGSMICRHINGIRTECRLENLEWGTNKENASDTIRHGSHSGGGRRFGADDFREMRRMHSEGMSYTQIAKQFNTVWGTVQLIVAFKRHRVS